ncbi:SDR family NAD(P)-dependent oxidoreductase [Acidiferrimicrobium sp. IK]|uniref:type I polyketide synthase n=1 Tax=Acidiferrimicrobium sp. IK TaxID=2871700 RepID=UPI0021CB2661|nr:type I polyketide synthase [Acidiferrimicrobium sp. IK]MCU4187005.1 SDR family NAD(P)-dependent oxidoreductase [Acidiferrimicrobium sp. IK]
MPGPDDILAVDPFGRPNHRLVVAAARAGATGVLDLAGAGRPGCPDRLWAEAVDKVAARVAGAWAVRVAPGQTVELPETAQTVVLAGRSPTPDEVAIWSGRRVLVEVTSLEEGREALAAGAEGLWAKGCEAGGRAGKSEGFVLAQQIARLGAPWWLASGVGPHTAGVARAAGATGFVLSDALALLEEVRPPAATAAAIAAMDGSETATLGGWQVWARPGSPAALLRRGPGELSEGEVVARIGTDVRRDLVPAGPDTALAARMAEQWRTVAGVVAAMRDCTERSLAAARHHRPLAPGNALAGRHGLRYGVAQGPMTRVSDRAAFAAAVADDGGLPFVALALLSGGDTRSLLTETAAALGGRPWGVGILGFVPPEVRAAQLEVVRELRPPLALIAGGRPAQARSLEDDGIATFIHVPSPGLLEQFLAQGARRFVFEGRECGGHVGPRTSLSLWEAQAEVLRRHGDLAEVEVLLAGGIHDATSSAMAATVLGPLAGAGAAVGVLMGSAYLFTAEAVEGGAITSGYQQAALGCRDTVLLETSPGHATRCVDSPYVATFQRRKEELIAAGTDAAAMWAELEELNLGRLRLASKGLARTAGGTTAVDDATAAAEGMFMIGQVAALRSEPTTIAALHEEVTSGGAELVERVAAAPVPAVARRGPSPLDIAIVGMAGVFPQASDVETFWADVVAGRDAVSEVPAARWDTGRYFDPDPALAGRRTPSRWGGFIPAVDFDPLAYGIPPSSLNAIEPVQLLALKVADAALADAGYAHRPFPRERTSVIFGGEGGTDLQCAYNFRVLADQYLGVLPPELEEHLPVYSEDSFPGVLTNVIAGRIANRLDLGGVNYTVDAACASALAALDAACKELAAGGSDMVLCGGADLHNGINDYLLFSSVRALSPTGRSRPFDASSDGIALGEAVACVVLKRRADAERDGDRVYAVIDAVGGSSDGRHLGLTAPRKEGQQLAVRRAYAQAGYGPDQVGLVEAHGTGTAVGDRTELATLTETFGDHGAAPSGVVLGSVKSQVGHTKCAAGLVGLVKVARSVYHGVLPPTLHIAAPHAAYDPERSPFRFLAAAQPWPQAERHAAVSAFGFGGTNFHAVISAAPDADRPAHGVGPWPCELVIIRAATMADAKARAGRLADLAERVGAADPAGARHRLRDLAYTVCAGADEPGAGLQPAQLAVVARDWSDLAERLRAAAAGRADPGGVYVADEQAGGGVAFLFPGQGSQRPNMLADVLVAFPWLAPILAAGAPWQEVMFPPGAYTDEQRAAQIARITATDNAQPSLGIAAAAMTAIWDRLGVRPDAVAGHSYGELPALAAAGCFDLAALVQLSAARAAAMTAAAAALGDDPGTMAAVSLGADEVREMLGDSDVVVANHNSPRQSVISGPTAAVGAAVEALSARKVGVRPLAVACAFHSPLVSGGAAQFLCDLRDVPFSSPALPVIAGSSAAPYPPDPDASRTLLAEGIASPVRWVEQVEALYASGIRTFVEVGPGRVLSHLVGAILGERPHVVVASDVAGENGITRLLLACARMATTGVELDTEALFAGRAAPVDLASLPLPAAGWSVDGHLVRGGDGTVVAGGLQPADTVPSVAAPGGAATAAPDQRDAAVLGYLKSMQDAIAAQRDVMLRYLGETAPVTDVPATAEAAGPGGGGLAVPLAGGAAPGEPVGSAAPGASAGPVPVAGAGAGAAPPDGGADPAGLLTRIVSERTGYPPAMLDLDADLEADLSIDSIKRLEILSEVMDRAGIAAADDDTLVEEVARITTLRGVAQWLTDHRPPETEPGAADRAAEPGAADRAEGAQDGNPSAAAGRFVVEREDLPPASTELEVAGQEVVIVVRDGFPLADATEAELREAGTSVSTVRCHPPHQPLDPELRDALAGADIVVYLAAAEPGAGGDALWSFPLWQAALGGTASRWLAVTVDGGMVAEERPGSDARVSEVRHPAGLAGVVKVAAIERAGLRARVLDLDGELVSADPAAAARLVLEELRDGHPAVDVGRRGARRIGVRIAAVPAPAGSEQREALGPDSVVLLTGGARGITAAVARALHSRFGSRIELAGRTRLDGDEDPRLAGADDLNALRRRIAELGHHSQPAHIDAAARAVLASREARQTVRDLTAAGAAVRYHALDVTDELALAAVVDDVYARHGRIDAVVHGAGIIDDRLIADKTAESFASVWATKVGAARALLRCLRPGPGVLVLFGSVSGVWGNRGQVDYAAANHALDTLAWAYDGVEDRRVVSIDWGPWRDAGMVTGPLAREYARRGIDLLGVDEGVSVVLDVMADPDAAPCQMIAMAGPLPSQASGAAPPAGASEGPGGHLQAARLG